MPRGTARVGERPIPGDGLPGFHVAVSRSGASPGVDAGGLVAAEVVGEGRSDLLEAFRFERR